ncbi:hypothetical protein [Streptomyces sp. NPDC059176]|uniref:hypothetical protein n=1 Tax=Streptomyces sp. NPDC059176 TaxID=3346758 RepID=UPI00368605E3
MTAPEAPATATGGGLEPTAPDGGPFVVRLSGPPPADLRGPGLCSPGAVLVRPDGVISAAGPFTDPDPGRWVEAALSIPATGSDAPPSTSRPIEKGR